ncbi:SDR family NAD(P)-dependent oxidoreductase [Enterovirga sp. CN4-39]|uniref:SDR family NAD(P)-dependent oxidoreductase n=1 Tax=Enterovirga sp. CN4-39 TaxID=3400910 RepID=UPI003BFCB44D
MAGPLSGRHALVTGGSRGIGRAIAASLTQAGAQVVVLGRDTAALESVVAAGEAQGFALADVSDPAAIQAAVARLEHPVDLLVANAGSAVSKPFARTDSADFSAMLAVNLMGVVNAVQAVLPGMTERGFGRIVAVASTAGLKGYPYVTAYCSAKHAVVGLVRSLALEIARTGVTINAVCPGYTDTDMVASSLDRIVEKTGRTRDAALAELTKSNPQGRLVQPAEVADAVTWMCGAGAGSITGQAIAVAGGEV